MAEDYEGNVKMETKQPTPQPSIKEEVGVPQEAESQPVEEGKPIETADATKKAIPVSTDASKGPQGPSPPSSNDPNTKPDPTGLSIDTTSATDAPDLDTPGQPVSAIDSLFDMPTSGNNDGSDMAFESMEFLEAGNTQGQTDFDLSTFGTSQDFNMPDLDISNDTNTNIDSGDKQDDLFGKGNMTGGGDMMDIDLDLGTAGGYDSIFDDMFFTGADDTNAGSGGEMDQGVFDDAYFRL